jgi:hypothetical protein
MRSWLDRFQVGAVALAIVLAAGVAHADEVGVVVTGEATLQPPLAASLEGWMREHGHRLVSSPLDAESINALIDCFVLEDVGCARAVVERHAKAATVVYARVDVSPGTGGMGDITLVAYWLQKGHDSIGERRTCQHCSPQTLNMTADDLMAALAAEPPPPDPSAPRPVAPKLEVRAQDASPPSRLVPAIVVGAGAACALTGISLLALDSSPTPTGAQQPHYRDYGPPGYALLGIGVAAVGAGAYLWWHGRAGSAPVAAVSPGGGVVGWTGSF